MTQAMRRLPTVKRWVLNAKDASYAGLRVDVYLMSALKRRPPANRVEVVVKVFRGES